MAAEFTLTRTVTNLSKGISTVKQHHEFMPYKLDNEISFELTDRQSILLSKSGKTRD